VEKDILFECADAYSNLINYEFFIELTVNKNVKNIVLTFRSNVLVQKNELALSCKLTILLIQ